MKKDLRFENYFLFSQNSLSTFDSCPMKFKRRYMDGLKWNNIPIPEVKERIEKGRDFHLMAHRYFSGIAWDEPFYKYEEPELWMNNLKRCFPIDKDNIYLPEYVLRMCRGNLRLEADYDLIIVRPDGKVEIWDWKTHYDSPKKRKASAAKKLISSYQTIVYLFILKELFGDVIRMPLNCSNISMSYWSPDTARIICTIEYSEQTHEDNRKLLLKKVGDILSYDYHSFDRTAYLKHCDRCEFSLLCNNKKPDFGTIDDDADFMDSIDWEDIEEKF